MGHGVFFLGVTGVYESGWGRICYTSSVVSMESLTIKYNGVYNSGLESEKLTTEARDFGMRIADFELVEGARQEVSSQ